MAHAAEGFVIKRVVIKTIDPSDLKAMLSGKVRSIVPVPDSDYGVTLDFEGDDTSVIVPGHNVGLLYVKKALTTPAKRHKHRSADITIADLDGQLLTVLQWAKRTGVLPATIRKRLRSGWPPYEAATTPPRRRGKTS